MSTKPTALKVMSLLLYGYYDYVVVSETGLVHLSIGPFARHLRVKNSRMKEYLDWLADWDYIKDLTHYHGYATFRIVEPRLLRETKQQEK